MPLSVATRQPRRLIGQLVGALAAFVILLVVNAPRADAAHREFCGPGNHSNGYDHPTEPGGSPPGDGKYFWSWLAGYRDGWPVYHEYLHHYNGFNEIRGAHRCILTTVGYRAEPTY